jgi:hypothetical protein
MISLVDRVLASFCLETADKILRNSERLNRLHGKRYLK